MTSERLEHPTAEPEQPAAAVAHPSGWTGGRIAVLASGVLLVLISLGLLAGGVTALWADRTKRDGGYVTTGVHEFSTVGSALVTKRTELGSAGIGWLYSPTLLDRIRIRVTPVSTDSPLFVGIGPSTDVDRYLAGVRHTVISDFWGEGVEPVVGGEAEMPPGSQNFWVASTTGSGTRTLEWDPTGGTWTVVVMNADGRHGVDVETNLAARMPALPWIGAGVLAVGALLFAGGAFLIREAIRRRRSTRDTTV